MNRITAACVIIGDEVLNGKICDTNSRYFAKFCFQNGIQLQEIITIADNEQQIIDTVQRLKPKYNFIVTTGGIGSTHDDITYECLAKSFGLPCKIDPVLQQRMHAKSNPEARLSKQALSDYYKMATLPAGDIVKNYYVSDDLWVPVCSINSQVFIFPGIPQLFEKMLNGLKPILAELFQCSNVAQSNNFVRFYVTTKMTESMISHGLSVLQEDAKTVSDEIKIGSYPHFGMGFNTISILGDDKHRDYLRTIVTNCIEQFDGVEITEEIEEENSNSRDSKF